MTLQENKEDRLPRHQYYETTHKNCGWRIVALYIYHKRKWLKIGEYCSGCGKNHIFLEFQKGSRFYHPTP